MKNYLFLMSLSLTACVSEGSTPTPPLLDAYSHVIPTNQDWKSVKLKVMKHAPRSLSLFAQKEKDYSKGIVPFSQSPGAVDLGMSNVPVLDQGQEGTCVTFSTTAALDALYGLGDFIDQQCSLELDQALGSNYWNGADFSSQIIAPLKQYGIVQKGHCNAFYADPNAVVTLDQYASYKAPSNDISGVQYIYDSGITVDQVKTALKAGHRVTIGFMLLANDSDPVSVEGYDIKVNGLQKVGGLWACQQGSTSNFLSYENYCGQSDQGHEVVVIGFDDAQQLFKIRNSWNTSVGDSGNFYMTYVFFQAMVSDGTEIF